MRALAIGDLIVAEVLQGFDSDHDFKSAQRLLTSLPVVAIGGPEIAIQAAKNYRVLRQRGVTIRAVIRESHGCPATPTTATRLGLTPY